MDNDSQFGNGVGDVFDAIASTPKSIPKQPMGRRDPAPAPPTQTQKGSEDMTTNRSLRAGRLPGRQNGPPKMKVTGRVSHELRNAYVDWAFDDRCTLSDLIDRALNEFYQRHRAIAKSKETKPSSNSIE